MKSPFPCMDPYLERHWGDLQTIVEQCYRNGGYDDIDYKAEPDPALKTADAKWADALLRELGRR